MVRSIVTEDSMVVENGKPILWDHVDINTKEFRTNEGNII